MKDRYVLGVGYPSLSESDDPFLIGMDRTEINGDHINLRKKAPKTVFDGDTRWRLVLERVSAEREL